MHQTQCQQMIFCTKGFGCKCPAGYSGRECNKGIKNKLYIIKKKNDFNAVLKLSTELHKQYTSICMNTFFLKYYIIINYITICSNNIGYNINLLIKNCLIISP